MKSVCMFVSVCREDECWVPQFLAEAERLKLPFAVHLDRLTNDRQVPGPTFERMVCHRLCVGVTSQPNQKVEFTEQHKQEVFDKVASLGYQWAFASDIDETYEQEARWKIEYISELDADLVDVRWLNLWGDKAHVRVDLNFATGHRVKFYNLRSGKWVFDHPITNGAKLQGREAVTVKNDLVCLHHGMMTPELRRLHKERWDRIYSTALRGDPNPLGFWRQAIETEKDAVLIRHGYF
jgi:hypothetical protein